MKILALTITVLMTGVFGMSAAHADSKYGNPYIRDALEVTTQEKPAYYVETSGSLNQVRQQTPKPKKQRVFDTIRATKK